LENAIQQTTVDVGDNLFESFNDLINKLTVKGKKFILSCQSVFQADSIMAGRMVSGDTDIILTSDSDQAALLVGNCDRNYVRKTER
jgi:hypothetical protein